MKDHNNTMSSLRLGRSSATLTPVTNAGVRHSMRTLIRTMTLLLIWFALAVQAKDVEAYIMIDVSGNDVASVTFTNLESNESIRISRDGKKRRSVKPGSYYLKRVDSLFTNVHSPSYPTPEEPLFIIEPGTVVYLGDWKFEYRAVGNELKLSPLSINYTKETVRELITDPTICERLSCMMLMPDGTVRRLALHD